MLRPAVFVLGLVLAMLMVACGPGNANAPSAPNPRTVVPSGNAIKGKELFAQTCVACHGADAKGLPNLGKNLTTSAFVKSKNDRELVKFLNTGRPVGDPLNTTGVAMPPKGGNTKLTDTDLADIAAFLHSLQE